MSTQIFGGNFILRIGPLGFGGIGKSAHLPPHLALEKEGISKLISVCDITPERFDADIEINTGSSTASLPENVHRYTDFDAVFKKLFDYGYNGYLTIER